MSWSTEVIGLTLRVIDEEGNDVCVIGDCHSKRNQEFAKILASAPALRDALVPFTRGVEWVTEEQFELARNLVARLDASNYSDK